MASWNLSPSHTHGLAGRIIAKTLKIQKVYITSLIGFVKGEKISIFFFFGSNTSFIKLES